MPNIFAIGDLVENRRTDASGVPLFLSPLCDTVGAAHIRPLVPLCATSSYPFGRPELTPVAKVAGKKVVQRIFKGDMQVHIVHDSLCFLQVCASGMTFVDVIWQAMNYRLIATTASELDQGIYGLRTPPCRVKEI